MSSSPAPGTPRSHWLNEALAPADLEVEPLGSDTTADVLIVGGGFTGLWTALTLKQQEPALDVVLIERDICGGGASGRNGGFLSSWWAKYLSLEKIAGSAEAQRLARASETAIDTIIQLCADEDIDAQVRHDGWLWTATNRAQVGAWQDTMDALAAHDLHPLVPWSPDDVAARSGSNVHIAGVYEQNAASLQPAILARGLRRLALEKGVRIYERTPLENLTHGVPARIKTPHATIRAERVVIAMNAWATRWADVRRTLAVVSGDIVMTAPIGEQLERIGWRDGLGISDGRALVNYYRTTPDGRIVFGKGGMGGEFCYGGNVGNVVEGRSPIADRVTAAFRQTYPMLHDVEIETNWRGPVDRSQSGLPHFAPLGAHGNVHYGAGFSGNGVGPCHVAGHILASLALGLKDEWSGSALVRDPGREFPPEPFRFIGSHMLRRALISADEAQDQNRTAPLTSRLLARFAPAGVSPFRVKGDDD